MGRSDLGGDAVHRHSLFTGNNIVADGGEPPRQRSNIEQRKAECMRALFAIGAATVMLGAAMVNASGGSPDQASSKPAIPTFTKDVAPILYKNCTAVTGPARSGRCRF